MITSDESKPDVVQLMEAQNQQKEDYINRLTMDMTELDLSSIKNDLGKPMEEESKNYKKEQESNWLSELVESRGSVDSGSTYMYDSINTQISQEKTGYAYEENMTEVINKENLNFGNIDTPLFDYYPTYNLKENINHGDITKHLQDHMRQNQEYSQMSTRPTSFQYNPMLSESIPPNEMMVSKQLRKNMYQQQESYVFLKILATQLVSGTIIGRGGKGLNWFRRKSKVDDIVLSMPWELYPKTEYRTLLLKGTLNSVIKSTCIIAELMNSRYSLLTDNSMMVMVVLPEVFLTAIEEIKKTTNPELLSITLFRDDNSQHQEIVAVLKGERSKVKDLISAITTSISETIPPERYCFVSYNNEEYGYTLQNSDSSSETVKSIQSSRSYSTYTNTIKNRKREEVDTLINQIENAVDKENIETLSKISTLIKNKPELLSKLVEVQINLENVIPEETMALTSAYKCDIVQKEQEGNVNCKITGQFARCFATLLLIFTKMAELNGDV